MNRILIAPSLLSANFACLKEEVVKLQQGGADLLHFDVMDGSFVDNISFGIPVFKSISRLTNLINDVHLMIQKPHRYFDQYIENNAKMITFHLEAYKSKKETIAHLKYLTSKGIKAGLSIKPKTSIKELYPFLPYLNQVLVMSVEPGFGGQTFLPETPKRIEQLKDYLRLNKYQVEIEVDGGITKETAPLVLLAGATILVSGSYIFKASSYKDAIASLR